jgi:hypothetical protein
MIKLEKNVEVGHFQTAVEAHSKSIDSASQACLSKSTSNRAQTRLCALNPKPSTLSEHWHLGANSELRLGKGDHRGATLGFLGAGVEARKRGKAGVEARKRGKEERQGRGGRKVSSWTGRLEIES